MICIIRLFSQKSKRNSRFPATGQNAGTNGGPVRKDSKMKESSSNVFVQLNESKNIRKFQKMSIGKFSRERTSKGDPVFTIRTVHFIILKTLV